MESLNNQMKRDEALEMITRFTSKEVLYRYLTLHVELFLPTMEGTKISFVKAILCEKKKTFKNKEIKLIEIPNYPENSVTILLEDTKKEEDLVVYIPTKKQLSDKLPERNFFLGVLGTLSESYLKEIIEEAHKKRYSISPEDQKKQGTLINENWLAKSQRSIHSSLLSFDSSFLGKPGPGLFLMKEHAKVHSERKQYSIHEVSKRLYENGQKPEEMNIYAGTGTKRRNMVPCKPQEEKKKEKPNSFMGQLNM